MEQGAKNTKMREKTQRFVPFTFSTIPFARGVPVLAHQPQKIYKFELSRKTKRAEDNDREEAMINRRRFLFVFPLEVCSVTFKSAIRNTKSAILVCALLFALNSVAEAQQVKKIPRIGYLGGASPSANAARIEVFRQGLRELGYEEGKNIIFEWRYAEGKQDRLPDLAAELVRLKVDLIVTAGPASTRAAKEATVTIPIVMASDTDPVGNGFVASLARPGRNITGLSTLAPEISGKQLELLKEIVPRLSRVAVFGTSTQPGNAQALRETEHAAETLKVVVQYLDVSTPKDIEPAFRAASKGRADALLVLASPVVISQRKQVVDLVVKSRLVAIYNRPEYVEDGGLMTYGVSINDLFRRAATYVDKILKGTKPADLPVEQPTKFELVINLKTAKQIGVTIPQSVLYRADKVIK